MRDAVRVALLARPGAGADRLREALSAAGAELVLEADPTTLQPATLVDARADSVVVVLDPAVEDALDRLDGVLHDPGIDVLYEESSVAAAREGWDVARWTRHLSAKLLRHQDVLPPGREADAAVRADGPASGPRASAPELVAPAPAPPTLADPVPAASASPPPSMFDPVAAEYEPGDDATAAAGAVPAPADAPGPPTTFDWGDLTLEMPDEAPADAAPPAPAPPAAEAPAPPPPASPAAAPGPRGDAIRDFRRDLAGIEQRIASMGLVADDPPAPAPDEADVHPVEAPAGNVAEDTPVAGLEASSPPDTTPSDAPPPAPAPPRAAGAVLVFAGIGGPDAVRQFLGALPAAFPRPVLIHQRLDGGRHDRLVQQMARATSLPVHLATEDGPVAPGNVYILPPGLGLSGTDGLRFVASSDPMGTLPSADSAVLMFSGSDTALVDAAMDHAQAGAMVAGQSPEDCYDAAAADALVARGAESGQPAELARRLAGRWAA